MKRKDISKFTVEEIVQDMQIGWNLGNSLDATAPENKETATLEQFETCWGNPVITKDLIKHVVDAGFGTIRVPVTWWKKVDSSNSEYRIDPAWLARVKEVVDYVYEEGIYVIIDVHHEEEWLIPTYETLDRNKTALSKIWLQISEVFKDYDDHLIFEAMNETRLVGTKYEWTSGTEDSRHIINILNEAAVNAIRSTGGNNVHRPIMLNAYAGRAEATALNDMVIPNNDKRIILSAHCYSPYEFCMAADQTDQWGTEGEKKDLIAIFDEISQAAKEKNCPLIIGEFGTINKNNEDIRAAYSSFFVSECRKRGITCIIWDNSICENADSEIFGLFNRICSKWQFPKIIDAIIKSSK